MLDQKRDFDLARIASRSSFRRGTDGSLSLGGFYAYKHLDHAIFQVLDQLSHDVGVDVRFESGAVLAGKTHRLVAGLSPSVGRLEDDRYVNVRGERGNPTASGRTRSASRRPQRPPKPSIKKSRDQDGVG